MGESPASLALELLKVASPCLSFALRKPLVFSSDPKWKKWERELSAPAEERGHRGSNRARAAVWRYYVESRFRDASWTEECCQCALKFHSSAGALRQPQRTSGCILELGFLAWSARKRQNDCKGLVFWGLVFFFFHYHDPEMFNRTTSRLSLPLLMLCLFLESLTLNTSVPFSLFPYNKEV